MSCTKDHKEGVDPKKKGPLGKLKESLDDKEEQLEILGTFIRLGVMVWAGFIISLNYITFPGLAKDGGPKDITFIASVFTGCLATFSVDVGKKKKENKRKKKLSVKKEDDKKRKLSFQKQQQKEKTSGKN